MLTWQNNLWLTVREFVKIRERPLKFVSPWIDVTAEDKKLKEVRNRSIRLATLDYCETMDMASCIIVLRKMTNLLRVSGFCQNVPAFPYTDLNISSFAMLRLTLEKREN